MHHSCGPPLPEVHILFSPDHPGPPISTGGGGGTSSPIFFLVCFHVPQVQWQRSFHDLLWRVQISVSGATCLEFLGLFVLGNAVS